MENGIKNWDQRADTIFSAIRSMEKHNKTTVLMFWKSKQRYVYMFWIAYDRTYRHDPDFVLQAIYEAHANTITAP